MHYNVIDTVLVHSVTVMQVWMMMCRRLALMWLLELKLAGASHISLHHLVHLLQLFLIAMDTANRRSPMPDTFESAIGGIIYGTVLLV